jgi:hypothetical protein
MRARSDEERQATCLRNAKIDDLQDDVSLHDNRKISNESSFGYILRTIIACRWLLSSVMRLC